MKKDTKYSIAWVLTMICVVLTSIYVIVNVSDARDIAPLISK